MPSTPQKFYLTTPIYYVNARPHIGHAYTTIVADVLARRHRLLGDDTFFLTGTDEHGQKIERSAAAAGIDPQLFTDQVSAQFKSLWDRMGLTYDDYIRTTEPRHKQGAQKLFTELYDRGFIYLSTYTGAYCVSDEAFVDLPVGTPCPDCGRLLEQVTEENFFFKLSEFQLPLLNLIESNELLIEPATARNEVLSFLRGNISSLSSNPNPATLSNPNPVILSGAQSAQSKDLHDTQPDTPAQTSSTSNPTLTTAGTPYIPGALKDLSISRSSFTWGIPVPDAVQKAAGTTQNHVIYVWLDALANYMTAIGYGSDDPAKQAEFKKYWPADLHLVGKEITRFHCVYWPAFLLALNPVFQPKPSEDRHPEPEAKDLRILSAPAQLSPAEHATWAKQMLPRAITANGWLLFDNAKMSKSRGNVVRTETILEAFGTLCPAAYSRGVEAGFSPPSGPREKGALAPEKSSSTDSSGEQSLVKGTASAVASEPATDSSGKQSLVKPVLSSVERTSAVASEPTPDSSGKQSLVEPLLSVVERTSAVASEPATDSSGKQSLVEPVLSGVERTSAVESQPATDSSGEQSLVKGTASAVPSQQPTESALAAEVHSPTRAEKDLFASDVLRYFLLREIPFGQDGSFSFDAMITRYNADLANGYGNLVSRTLNMVQTNFPNGFERTYSARFGSVTVADGLNSVLTGQWYVGESNDDSETSLEEDVALRFTNNDFSLGLREIYSFISQIDGYMSANEPWKLAKLQDESSSIKLESILYISSESIRIITALLYPIMPYATARVWAQLGLGDIELAAKNGELKNLQWGGLKPGTKLGPLSPIFPRADKSLAETMIHMENENARPAEPLKSAATPTTPLADPTSTTDPAAPPRALDEPTGTLPVGGSSAITTERPQTPHADAPLSAPFSSPVAQTPITAMPADASPQITIDDFIKVELRIAQILVAERIPKADKLLRLEVDLGTERRQILSGIAEWYTPEDLIGRRIIVITNLAPRKMRGLESHGMLLAGSEEGGKPYLATVPEGVPVGTRLK